MWKKQYLLNLRDRSHTKCKSPRVELSQTPKIGDVVQIKENTPRGTWKIGRMIELINSREGNIKAVTVLLQTRRTVTCPVKLLYPMECGNEQITDLADIAIEGTSDRRNEMDENKGEVLQRRSIR